MLTTVCCWVNPACVFNCSFLYHNRSYGVYIIVVITYAVILCYTIVYTFLFYDSLIAQFATTTIVIIIIYHYIFVFTFIIMIHVFVLVVGF